MWYLIAIAAGAFFGWLGYLSDGRRDWELSDSYLDGTNFLVIGFTQEGSKPRFGLMSDAEIAAYLRKREAE